VKVAKPPWPRQAPRRNFGTVEHLSARAQLAYSALDAPSRSERRRPPDGSTAAATGGPGDGHPIVQLRWSSARRATQRGSGRSLRDRSRSARRLAFGRHLDKPGPVLSVAVLHVLICCASGRHYRHSRDRAVRPLRKIRSVLMTSLLTSLCCWKNIRPVRPIGWIRHRNVTRDAAAHVGRRLYAGCECASRTGYQGPPQHQRPCRVVR
jgi:hypothetical protein